MKTPIHTLGEILIFTCFAIIIFLYGWQIIAGIFMILVIITGILENKQS